MKTKSLFTYAIEATSLSSHSYWVYFLAIAHIWPVF
jgi:hypothetical protein